MEGKPMHLIPVAELGECVHTIFKPPRKYAGKCIGLSSCLHTVNECAQIMEKALNGKLPSKPRRWVKCAKNEYQPSVKLRRFSMY